MGINILSISPSPSPSPATEEGAEALSLSFDIHPIVALTIAAILTIGAIVGFYYFWDKTHRPKRVLNKIPTPTFSNIFKRAVTLALKTDKEPMSANKGKKFLPWIVFNYITLTISYLFFPIGAAAGVPFWALPIPLIFTVLVISGRVKSILDVQDKALDRIYKIAKSKFKYPAATDLNPWSQVKINSWVLGGIPENVTIVIPATFDSSFFNARNDFEKHFDSAAPPEALYTYEWDIPNGTVTCIYSKPIPTKASYPGSDHRSWDEIPLGIGRDGEVFWKVTKDPHMLIAGPTGSGKSVAQRNIISHCIQHSDMWRFIGIDVKKVELSQYEKYDDAVIGVAIDKEEGVQALRKAADIMDKRYTQLKAAGISNFTDLPVVPPALMILIDEGYEFLSPSTSKTEEGKQITELANEAIFLVGSIARLGRAAGIHLVMGMQRPDAKIFFGEIKNNFTARYAAGPMKSTASQMLLDTTDAVALPSSIKGRGVVMFNTEIHFLQTYYQEADWIDEWLERKNSTPEDESSNESEKSDNAGMYQEFSMDETSPQSNSGTPAGEKINIKETGIKGLLKKVIDEFKDPDGENETNKSNNSNKDDTRTKKTKQEYNDETLNSYDAPENPEFLNTPNDENSTPDETPVIKENNPENTDSEDIFYNETFNNEKNDSDDSTVSETFEDDFNVDLKDINEDTKSEEDKYKTLKEHGIEVNSYEEHIVDKNIEGDVTENNTDTKVPQDYSQWDDDLEKLFTHIPDNIPSAEEKPVNEDNWGGSNIQDLFPDEDAPLDESVKEGDEPNSNISSEDNEQKPEKPLDEELVTEDNTNFLEDNTSDSEQNDDELLEETLNSKVEADEEVRETYFDTVSENSDSFTPAQEEIKEDTIKQDEPEKDDVFFDSLSELESLFGEEENSEIDEKPYEDTSEAVLEQDIVIDDKETPPGKEQSNDSLSFFDELEKGDDYIKEKAPEEAPNKSETNSTRTTVKRPQSKSGIRRPGS